MQRFERWLPGFRSRRERQSAVGRGPRRVGAAAVASACSCTLPSAPDWGSSMPAVTNSLPATRSAGKRNSERPVLARTGSRHRSPRRPGACRRGPDRGPTASAFGSDGPSPAPGFRRRPALTSGPRSEASVGDRGPRRDGPPPSGARRSAALAGQPPAGASPRRSLPTASGRAASPPGPPNRRRGLVRLGIEVPDAGMAQRVGVGIARVACRATRLWPGPGSGHPRSS